MGMSTDTAIQYLKSKRALEAVAFFVVNRENKGPQISCRLWDGLSLTQNEAETLVEELNKAIGPISKKWSSGFGIRVRENFPD